MAPAAEGQARVFVGLKKSRTGSKAECQGEEDGERAPHGSL